MLWHFKRSASFWSFRAMAGLFVRRVFYASKLKWMFKFHVAFFIESSFSNQVWKGENRRLACRSLYGQVKKSFSKTSLLFFIWNFLLFLVLREKVTRSGSQIGFIQFVLIPMFEAVGQVSQITHVFCPF
jgi:hypothetical protein